MSRFCTGFNPTLRLVCLGALMIGACTVEPLPQADVAISSDETSLEDVRVEVREMEVVSMDAEEDFTQAVKDVAQSPWPRCLEGYEEYAVVATLDSAVLVEASGLVASHLQPGILWSHNDSGDAPNVYGISTEGQHVATVSLPGVDPVDIEDIARARCPSGDGDCLWVADVGNNNAPRDEFSVYVVPEPTLEPGAPLETFIASTLWVYRFSYPSDAPDSEGLIVAPDGTKFWLFEKADGPTVRLFTTGAPLVDGETQVLVEELTFPAPGIDVPMGHRITGADLHPGGAALLLRTYTGVFEYLLDAPMNFSGLADEPTLVAWGPLEEAQGESVAYDASGLGAWTLSEDPQGAGYQPLIHYPCLSEEGGK